MCAFLASFGTGLLAFWMLRSPGAAAQVLAGALHALCQLRVQRDDADGVLQLLHHIQAFGPGALPCRKALYGLHPVQHPSSVAPASQCAQAVSGALCLWCSCPYLLVDAAGLDPALLEPLWLTLQAALRSPCFSSAHDAAQSLSDALEVHHLGCPSTLPLLLVFAPDTPSCVILFAPQCCSHAPLIVFVDGDGLCRPQHGCQVALIEGTAGAGSRQCGGLCGGDKACYFAVP